MPYRSAPTELPRRSAEPGLIDDMVRQFADSYAYLRELVQNAIDAGATRAIVRVSRDGNGQVRSTVDDDGCGMDRATLEGPLLTLFASSKEHDTSKIGKYGIGFMSVLASDPIHVEVSSTHGGTTHLLRLFGDHAYELSLDAASEQSGTRVTLLHTMSRDQMREHVERVRAALSRWCRHIRIPLQLHVADADDPGASFEIALGEPFELRGAIASARLVVDDERLVVGVFEASQPSFLGYYNRGIALWEGERSEPNLHGLAVKIDSPALAHTLSRDDVRRDRSQRKLVERAVKLATGELKRDLLTQLTRAANDANVARVAALLDALLRPAFGDVGDALVPLVSPIDGRTTSTLRKLVARAEHGIACELEESPTSRMLAELDIPVVRGPQLTEVLARYARDRLVGPLPDDLEVACVEPMDGPDRALLSALSELLELPGQPATPVAFARFSRHDRGLFRHVPQRADRVVLRALHDPPPGRLRLFVDAIAPGVAAARRAATLDVRRAAHLLARLLLLERGPIDPSHNDVLLERYARGLK